MSYSCSVLAGAVLGIATLFPVAACDGSKPEATSSEKTKKKSKKKFKKDPLAPLRAKVKKKLAAIAKLADKAKSAPLAGVASKPLTLKEKDYFVTEVDYLADPHTEVEKKDDRPKWAAPVLSLCAYGTSGDKDEEEDEDKDDLKECDAWKYVGVMRTQKWSAPVVDVATKSFEPGSYLGDLLVFKIDSGELLGSYPISVRGSGIVQREVKPGETAEQEKEAWEGMARADVTVEIEDAQERYIEGTAEE